MPAPSTTDEFLDLIRKSGIVDEKRLNPYLEKLRAAGGKTTEPTKLAGQMIRDGILTHFQAEQLLQGKWRRFTIGKYKVLERLGSGGMGSVYLCEHKLMRRRVAVKVLPTAKAAEPSSLERFYREARAVASLDHPNIVHAYDIDQDETLHFLVMEYVDGASLQEIIKKSGPMDPVRAAHYMYQAAQGLEHAHASGLVHRDIKPGNLLVDRGGTLKILDMGLARFFNDEEDILTKKYDENVLGTADYLAPEQAVDSHEADTRADIYSLGATFYFLLTGRTPFEEGTIAQKLIWHQTRQPKPISSYRSDVPAEMIATIDKMMAKRPEDRFQLPREVAEALALWAQRPIAPPPESEMPRLSPAAAGNPSEGTQSGISTQTGPGSSRKNWQVTPPAPTSRSSPSPAPAGAPAVLAAPALPKIPASSVAPAKPVVPAAPAVPAAVTATPKVATPPPAPALPPKPAVAPAAIGPRPTTNGLTTAPGDQLWADLTDDTAPRGSAETLAETKAPAPSSRRMRPEMSNRFWLIVTGAVGLGVVIVAVLLWSLLAQLFIRPTPTERRPLVVSKQRSGEGVYTSIASAARAAAAGDVIELADESIDENVQLTAAQIKATGLTLRAAVDKKVMWTCKSGSEDRPLLHLAGLKGFTFDGENITLNGQSKMANLILITGQSPGVQIKNLHLKGYTSHGIKIMNCTGDENKYVVLTKLQVEPGVPDKSAAVYLDADPQVKPDQNDYLDLRDCLFLGLSLKQSVDRKNSSVTGSHLKLPPGLAW